jgi:hypothetical protein
MIQAPGPNVVNLFTVVTYGENESNNIMVVKAKILETFSDKCDNFLNSNTAILFIVMIPYFNCITKKLIVIVISKN